MTQSSPLPPDTDDWSAIAPPAMVFAFRVRIFFELRQRFEPTTPMGGRVYVPPAGGDISGPLLNGRVVPYSGADWARGRADRCAELNAHYMLEADDGTPIYINNRGYLYGRTAEGVPVPPAVSASQAAPNPDGQTQWTIAPDTYFILTPVFDAPVGRHDWLTRHVFLGRGRRVPSPDHTVFDYFLVNPPKIWPPR